MTHQISTAKILDPTPQPQSLGARALAAGERLGFDLVGVAGVAPSPRLALFPDWIAAGRAGRMDYLGRRGEDGRYLREEIRAAWPWARSILCAAVVYNADLPRSTDCGQDSDRGWVSRYAWGDDYHDTLRARLEAWIEALRPLAPAEAQFKLTVDTAPLIEREAARQAGLGWQAKNTCLIHPRLGSYFFLGSIITSLDLVQEDLGPDPATASAALPDRCGSCTRCLEACPTQALAPYEMDASRCLAYLNIELRGSIPEEFRGAMGNNVLGCDICQDVCPWNRRAATTERPEFQPRPGLFAPLLLELAAMSEDDYRERFRHSAVKRAKYAGLRRNIAIAMGNSGNPAFVPPLQQWVDQNDPLLSETAAWALSQLRDSAMIFQLASAAFADQQAIPAGHSCDGDNTSPPLRWSGVPNGTRSLALVVRDPDAPGGVFTHWVLYDLPPTITELPSGQSVEEKYPLGGLQGSNSFGAVGYGGPCPPAGAAHHYVFTLYALNEPSLNLAAGAERSQVEEAMEGRTLAQTSLTGTYARPQPQ